MSLLLLARLADSCSRFNSHLCLPQFLILTQFGECTCEPNYFQMVLSFVSLITFWVLWAQLLQSVGKCLHIVPVVSTHLWAVHNWGDPHLWVVHIWDSPDLWAVHTCVHSTPGAVHTCGQSTPADSPLTLLIIPSAQNYCGLNSTYLDWDTYHIYSSIVINTDLNAPCYLCEKIFKI